MRVNGLALSPGGALVVATGRHLLLWQALTHWQPCLHRHFPPDMRAATRCVLQLASLDPATGCPRHPYNGGAGPASPPYSDSTHAAHMDTCTCEPTPTHPPTHTSLVTPHASSMDTSPCAGPGSGSFSAGATGYGSFSAGAAGSSSLGAPPTGFGTGLWSLPQAVLEAIIQASACPLSSWGLAVSTLPFATLVVSPAPGSGAPPQVGVDVGAAVHGTTRAAGLARAGGLAPPPAGPPAAAATTAGPAAAAAVTAGPAAATAPAVSLAGLFGYRATDR